MVEPVVDDRLPENLVDFDSLFPIPHNDHCLNDGTEVYHGHGHSALDLAARVPYSTTGLILLLIFRGTTRLGGRAVGDGLGFEEVVASRNNLVKFLFNAAHGSLHRGLGADESGVR